MKPVSSRIRLLAIDIDGTLLNSRYQVPEANLLALRRAEQAGLEVILVTGRRHHFALQIAQQLGFNFWIISSNGAVTRSSRGEDFHRDLLPAAVAADLCSQMEEFRAHMVLTFDKQQKGALVLERLDAFDSSIRGWLEKNSEYIECRSPIESALTTDPVQAMFCGEVARMKRVEERLQDQAVSRRVNALKTEYPARNLCIVDVLNRGCSKGHALRRWAEFRGLERAQVMAIGDNYNDVEMLEFAGAPFIMGNACDALKQNGWRVTLSNDECGVAAAVEAILR